jgi:ABC-type antimicrobial peptide transport system permease subunit
MSIFGALALFLAVFGTYGVLSYTVAQRMPEFGMRLALGATPQRLRLRVIKYGAALALLGISVGTLTILLMSRTIAALLYEVSPTDLPILLSSAGALFVVAVGAAASPALRAGRVEPLVAIRGE